MNTGGDEAEQVVRLSLKDFEVAAKLTGSVAKKCRPAAGVRAEAIAANQRQGTTHQYDSLRQVAESFLYYQKGLGAVHQAGEVLRRSLLRYPGQEQQMQ